jgi:hypothetical protein
VARVICKSRSGEGERCCQHEAYRNRQACPVEIGIHTEAASAAVELVLRTVLEEKK